MSESNLYLAYTSCEDRHQAEVLARGLVSARLAVCVNIGTPSVSIYPWKDALETAEEVVLTIKTAKACIEGLKAYVAAHHPYEVPELLLVPVADGLESYMNWAQDWMRAADHAD